MNGFVFCIAVAFASLGVVRNLKIFTLSGAENPAI